MAASNFERAFSLVLKHEGGYVDHPKDPGGATNLGVTIGTLSAHLGRPATKAEVRALTRDAVKPIYRKNYWNAVRGDDLPSGVDFAVYDLAVNSGPGRAAKMLQACVGVEQDGVVGSITIAAVKSFPPGTVASKLCGSRLAFLKRLPTWPTFGKGWSRRVEEVERQALTMAAESPNTTRASLPTPTPQTAAKPPAPVPVAAKGFWANLWTALKNVRRA